MTPLPPLPPPAASRAPATQPRHQAPPHAVAARPAPWVRRAAAVADAAGERGSAGQGAAADPLDAVASAVVPPTAGSGGSRDGSGGGRDQEGGGESGAEAALAALDLRVRHVGDTVAMVCRYEQAQCVWSARIPLHPELLPDTVLHMAYSPSLLALRFETSDWSVRELLFGQLTTLEALVAALLPPSCDVVVTL